MALTSAAKVFDSGKGGSKSFLLDRMTLSVTLEFWCEKEKSINGSMSRKINVDNTEESEWVLERMDGWRDHLLRLKGTVTMRCYGNKCLMCVCRKVTVKSMSFPNGCILIKKGKKDLWVAELWGHSFHCELQTETQEKNITGRWSPGSQLRLSEKGVEGDSKSQLSKEAFPAPRRVNTQHYLQNCSPVSSRLWILICFELSLFHLCILAMTVFGNVSHSFSL